MSSLFQMPLFMIMRSSKFIKKVNYFWCSRGLHSSVLHLEIQNLLFAVEDAVVGFAFLSCDVVHFWLALDVAFILQFCICKYKIFCSLMRTKLWVCILVWCCVFLLVSSRLVFSSFISHLQICNLLFADEDQVVSSVLSFGVVCSFWSVLEVAFVLRFGIC